jgi:hypothetical protein
MTRSGLAKAQFVRAVPRRGELISLTLDGQKILATEGESVLAALLSQSGFASNLAASRAPDFA